jgi:aminotransferase in exopolysaccharide biosynthesis
MSVIPLSVPNLGADAATNLKKCAETGWIATGEFIGEFEKMVAEYVGAGDAVACQSGTAGLHTALHILGVGPGDEVIVPTLTFIAAVNPVRYRGAAPVFLDCDDQFCMDAGKLERFCAEACELREDASVDGGTPAKRLVNGATGRTVKAIVAVHVFGGLCDMESIMPVAGRYGLKVLEDATEALGSYWTAGAHKGKHAGTVGDMGVYSFNANKIITTGGGGMIVARRPEYLERARYLTTTAKDDDLFFAHNEVGYNYRMLNTQAAIGVSQLKTIEDFIETKRRNFELYANLLEGVPGVRLLPFGDGIRANHWFYPLLVEGDSVRDRLMYHLLDRGVQCRPVWKLVHTQKPYTDFQSYGIEMASYYEKHILNIPCSSNLTEAEVRIVCEAIRGFAA